MHNLEGRVAEINRTAAVLLKSEVTAAGGRALVAGDMGPSGEIMAPLGTLDPAEAVDIFAEQAAALVAGGADVLWIETMSDLAEITAAIEGARRAAADVPIIATMTFDTRGHTMMGVSPEQAVTALMALGVDAVGGNCGNGPEEMVPVMTRMHAAAPGALLVAKSNAGMPRAGRHAGRLSVRTGRYGPAGLRHARGRRPHHRRLLRQHARRTWRRWRPRSCPPRSCRLTVAQATARLLLGGPLAQAVLATVAAEAAEYREAYGHAPALAVVVCGHEAPSMVYLRQILRGCEKVGLEGRLVEIEGEDPERGLVDALRGLGEDPAVAGIIVQMPLPAAIPLRAVVEAIDPAKDIDGIHPLNAGLVRAGLRRVRARHAPTRRSRS